MRISSRLPTPKISTPQGTVSGPSYVPGPSSKTSPADMVFSTLSQRALASTSHRTRSRRERRVYSWSFASFDAWRIVPCTRLANLHLPVASGRSVSFLKLDSNGNLRSSPKSAPVSTAISTRTALSINNHPSSPLASLDTSARAPRRPSYPETRKPSTDSLAQSVQRRAAAVTIVSRVASLTLASSPRALSNVVFRPRCLRHSCPFARPRLARLVLRCASLGAFAVGKPSRRPHRTLIRLPARALAPRSIPHARPSSLDPDPAKRPPSIPSRARARVPIRRVPVIRIHPRQRPPHRARSPRFRPRVTHGRARHPPRVFPRRLVPRSTTSTPRRVEQSEPLRARRCRAAPWGWTGP